MQVRNLVHGLSSVLTTSSLPSACVLTVYCVFQTLDIMTNKADKAPALVELLLGKIVTNKLTFKSRKI